MTASKWQPANLGELSRHIVGVGLSGIVTGLVVGGVGGRLFMRIAGATAPASAQGRLTEAGFRVGEVTAGGSLGLIIFIGLFTGIVGAMLLAIFHPWLAWARRWRGVAFGVVLFASGSATSDIQNPDNVDFRILDNPFVTVPLIVGLFLAFGVVMTLGAAFFVKRLPPITSRTRRSVYGILAALGVLGGLTILPGLFTDTFCSCEPPVVAASFIVIAMVGTLLWWLSTIRDNTQLTRIASRVGMVGLIGTTGFGLIRAVRDSLTILLQ